MPPLDILFITEHIDRSELHTFQGMHTLGHRVRVLTPQRNHVLINELDPGIETLDIPLNNRMDRESIRIIKETVAQIPDVVHCLRNNRPIANAIQALKQSKIPLVAYRGTSGHLSYWDPGSRLTYLHARIDKIICVSSAVETYFKSKKLPPSKLITIYKGHDPAWYRTATPTDISKVLGRQPHPFMLGFAGRMRHVKAADLILEAASLVSKEPPMDFLLVGEVADDKVAELAKNYSGPHGIHLPGFRRDAPALIQPCDAFIMPTRTREGLPRAVIEAMCQAIPPIVTKVGGMPELVRHEIDGLVIEPNSAQAIAEAIDRFRSDEAFRKTCGESAKRRIEEEFNISVTVEKTIDLYRSLIQG